MQVAENKKCVYSEKVPYYSLIVPVYNAEIVLKECIDSVMAQKNNDWELLLIDDGSQDKSFEVCKEYAEKSDKIFAYTKENGGSFSARLFGIQKAVGKYVLCVDADDIIADDLLDKLSTLLHEKEYDCVMWGYSYFGEQNGRQSFDPEVLGEFNRDEFLEMILKTTFHAFNNKAIRRDAIKVDELYSAPRVHISEDYIMVVPIICDINDAVVVSDCWYRYRVYRGSMSHSTSYTKLVDLCRVSEYGLSVMERKGLLNEKTLAAENIGYLRAFFDRFADAIYYRSITKNEIKSLISNSRFQNALMEVDYNAFDFINRIEMKLIKKECLVAFWLFRKVISCIRCGKNILHRLARPVYHIFKRKM